jgi:adenylate cyclase
MISRANLSKKSMKTHAKDGPKKRVALKKPQYSLEELNLLLEVSKSVAALNSLDEILNWLIEMAREHINADRGTIFINDPVTNELYSRVAQGNLSREIRIMNNSGLAGASFTSNEALLIHDVHKDPRFNESVDQQTGYRTKNMICVPIHNSRHELIGVVQLLNKQTGRFNKQDLEFLGALMTQGALSLEAAAQSESAAKNRNRELGFLNLVTEMTAEINIEKLLKRAIEEANKMLDAERVTLFLNDENTNELWSQVAQGLGSMTIRLPNTAGIAGAVFTSAQTINIKHAYADLRFNPSFDRSTGYFTRSILCVPIINKNGKVIGVTQALNKKNGFFSEEDESRLKAFTSQISAALENAALFADVENMKNYNEGVLQSITNAVLTVNEKGIIAKCNAAGQDILKKPENEIVGQKIQDFFVGPNQWLIDRLEVVKETNQTDMSMDASIMVGEETVSANVTMMPLLSLEHKSMGSIIMIENISSEKRMKSTMSRYMDPSIADQLLSNGADLLGGQSVPATVLFSDIRGFTTLTEALGAQGTVTLLNEYFEEMVDCITREGGMLDKFIGDAIMAAFGIPAAHEDDEDRAMRAAISMIKDLNVWNKVRLAEGKLPVNIGIGLNTDTVVSGNIGSKKRMDYTIIGDGVNLAARLESACKAYYAKILISEFTQARLKGTYRLREIDLVVVKGKTQPVSIYEVLDYHDELTFPNMMETLGHFKEGLSLYRKGDFSKSKSSFENALLVNGSDKLSKMYIDRNDYLMAHPPADDWSGIWVMEDK